MGKPPTFTKTSYRCSICGKKAVLGQHFCVVPAKPTKPLDQTEARQSRQQLLAALVATILLISFLWGYIGYMSLFVALLVQLVLVIYKVLTIVTSARRNSDYQKLLIAVANDRAVAERLITAERFTHPQKTRADCVKLALAKLRQARR